MTDISRRLEQVVHKELSKNILPVKTDKGILVGEALIVSEGAVKHISLYGQVVYKEISLNVVAIKLANLLAINLKTNIRSDAIYKADQEYGYSFIESQMLRAQYQRAVKNGNDLKADILWTKYTESRLRTERAKKHAETLTHF